MTGRYLIGSAIAAAAVYLLATRVDLGGSLVILRDVSPATLLLCAGIYVAAHVVRALRFSLVLGGGAPPFPEMFAVVSIHNLMNQLMPVRTGEGAYPVLLKRVSGIGYGAGVTSLLVVRVYDLATFFCMFIVFFAYRVFVSGGATLAGSALLVGLLALSLLSLRHVDGVLGFFIKALAAVVRRLGLGASPRLDMAGRLSAVAEEMKALETGGRFVRLTAQSVSIWLLTFAMFHAFVKSTGGGAGFVDTVLGSSGAVLTTLLPVNTFGSIGTLEGGWTLGLAAVGVDREHALASGLLMHGFVIVVGLALAAMGSVFLRLSAQREKAVLP